MKNLINIITDDLKVIEVTEGVNGYPQNLYKAVIGFDTYEDAQEFAAANGLAVKEFRQKEGWKFWECQGRAFGPFERKAEEYGDGFAEYEVSDTYLDDRKEYLKAQLDDMDFDDLSYFVKESQKVIDKLDTLDEGYVVLTYEGRYYSCIEKHPMSYSHDTWNYVIGCM